MLRSLIQGFGDLVYPPFCYVCRSALDIFERPSYLCSFCQESIQWNRTPACPRCSRYLGPVPKNCICTSCQKQKHHFDFAWSACLYEEPLRGLIHQFKFHQQTILRKPLSQLMIQFIEKRGLDIDQFDIILPIPLHAAKYRERGYNQAELLAVPLAQKYDKMILVSLLKRVRNTPSQTSLSRKNRFTNVQGSFKINARININNKNILIIDDLLTTGATASEASLCLKTHGAAKVGILTLSIA